MSTITGASNISAPTQFLQVKNDVYAYRRFGGGAAGTSPDFEGGTI